MTRSIVRNTTKLQVLRTLAITVLLAEPPLVLARMFSGFFHDHVLRILLGTVCYFAFMLPVYFKLDRHLTRRYSESPRQE